jgi:hypothetical protein
MACAMSVSSVFGRALMANDKMLRARLWFQGPAPNPRHRAPLRRLFFLMALKCEAARIGVMLALRHSVVRMFNRDRKDPH